MTSFPRRPFYGVLAAVSVAAGVALGAGAAHAAPALTVQVARVESKPLPSIPEPAAAIVFGMGVGLVAWKSRRSRPPA